MPPSSRAELAACLDAEAAEPAKDHFSAFFAAFASTSPWEMQTPARGKP
jgi:hypothetical protein